VKLYHEKKRKHPKEVKSISVTINGITVICFILIECDSFCVKGSPIDVSNFRFFFFSSLFLKNPNIEILMVFL